MRTRRPTLLALLVALAVGLAVVPVGDVGRAGAQAELVNVSTRTTPVAPDPGDDVTVQVRATGCPPGGSRIEVYHTSTDGWTSTAALMAREDTTSTLFFRLREEIELPNAIEGWYGVRLICGQFRPDREPMPNTMFRVGANPTKQMRVLGDRVEEGGVLRIEGDGCQGTVVEYAVNQARSGALPFVATGSIPVAFDGSWGGDALFSAALTSGRATVRARCGLRNQFGDQVWINYDQVADVEIVRAPSGP